MTPRDLAELLHDVSGGIGSEELEMVECAMKALAELRGAVEGLAAERDALRRALELIRDECNIAIREDRPAVRSAIVSRAARALAGAAERGALLPPEPADG